MHTHRTLLATLALVAALTLAVPSAYAQSVPIVAPGQGSVACTNLANNLSYGSSDTYTNGEVSTLQIFLYAKGYLAVSPVGQFGPLTLAGVKRFQSDHALPAYGYVGPLTRALIKNMTCSATAPTLQSMTPSSGAVGTTVTLYGSGFSKGSIVFFGPGVIRTLESASATSLTFVIPDAMGPYCAPGGPCPMYMTRLITPGDYSVHVQTDQGTSNSLIFTLTDGTTTSGTLSITGIDAPSTLPIGQSGTWTVHAKSTNAGGQLHYSVSWGDEPMYATSDIQFPGKSGSQTTTSFTHAYQTSGARTVTFTVTDDDNHSASVSSTIQVTPLY